MAIKPAHEELEPIIPEVGTGGEKRNTVKTRKDTLIDRKASEFINKSPSTIRKMPPRDIQYLVEDLQIQKIDLEIRNEKLQRAQLKLREQLAKYSDLYDNAPVGYFSMDHEGIILEANLTGAIMLGVERGTLRGRLFSDFITRDDQNIFHLHRKKLLETNARQRCELNLVKKNGAPFHAHLECIVLLNQKEPLDQFRVVVSDVNRPWPKEKTLH